jgi:hypothetical protein
MALWIIKLSLLALAGTMLIALVSVLRVIVVDRTKRPEEGHDRAEEREERWYPLR